MITPDYTRTLARYNRWMNDRIYAAAALLGDAERKRDLGAFIKSLHGTINHIRIADRLWLVRLVGAPVQSRSHSREIRSEFDDLACERIRTGDTIEAMATAVTPERLASPFADRTMISPRDVSLSFTFALVHFFNHQSHYRRQVTTLLIRMDMEPGVTYFIYSSRMERTR